MKDPKRYTVTAALPYTNGPVHIGHLAGCYLPSDIYVRFLRETGKDVVFVCGSDEHGVAITMKARQEGVTPQQLVDKYHAIIKKSFEDFGISFDIYSRTTSRMHYQTAQEFFKVLYDNDVFVKKTTTQFYDVEAAQFLADRYISGTCPNCQYEKAYGDQCEKCGSSLDPTDLINPVSMISGKTPELRKTEHWYLPLQKYEGFLKQYILEDNKDWKTNVLGQCRSWLNQGLQERSITRDMDWGVPVPIEGAEGKVLYVWMDAPIGYISFTKEWAEQKQKNWEDYWMDEETSLVHFIGKDNIVFHCIIFPSMLHAHGRFILPDNVPANEFLNIEGDKVSTSRNWAVWLHEYLEDFPGKQDVLRYVLTSIAPETKDSDFTWKDFQSRNNNELADIFGNLVNRVIILTGKYFNGKLPEQGDAGLIEMSLKKEVEGHKTQIEQLISNFQFREAQQSMMNIARAANKYLTETEPWKTYKSEPERTATILYYCIQVLGDLAVLCSPFLPETSQKLKKSLGIENAEWKEAGMLKLVSNETMIQNPEILFDKIEDEKIEIQINKLKKSPEEIKEIKKVEAFKENINFEDFSKIDLRVGTITEAEKVPKTDKLLKLTVNMGSEKRTIVSGIAESFDPKEIIGRQVSVIANLQPRMIKGIESKGMILMAEKPDSKLVFVSPAEMVDPGNIIR